MQGRSRWFGGALVAMLLVAGACGSDDDDDAAAGDDAATTTVAGSESTTTAPSDGGDDAGSDDPYAPQPLPEETEITFALSGNFEFVFPVHLAVLEGEFEKENLDVEVTQMPADAQLPALANGDVDIVGIGSSAASLNAINGGIPLQFFQNTHDSPSNPTTEGIWVRKELLTADGELDPEKVPGMKVVLGTQGAASPTVYVANQMVTAVGKTIDDVNITVLDPNADSLLALENGAVQAAHLLSPFSDDAALADCCVLIEPTVSAGRYAALSEELESRPEVFEAFVRALIRTHREYLQGNYHQDPVVAQQLSEFTGAPIENVQAASSYYVFGPEARNDVEMVETLQSMWLDFGDILAYDEPIPADVFGTQAIVDAVNGDA